MAIYEVFKAWHYYLKGTNVLIDVIFWITRTWNIFALHRFNPGDKLSGQHSYPDLTWLSDFTLAASELNPML
jgi:hypothetical protein